MNIQLTQSEFTKWSKDFVGETTGECKKSIIGSVRFYILF